MMTKIATDGSEMWHSSIFGNDSNKLKLIQEEDKRRLNSGNACYHSVQNLLSSRLLSKIVQIRIYKTTTLPLSCMVRN
jgi:hypothetical protein